MNCPVTRLRISLVGFKDSEEYKNNPHDTDGIDSVLISIHPGRSAPS